MILGCAWYPEHWSEERWPEDLRLMREARINMVRIAEFAWNRMERSEGRFDLDWLDRAVDMARNSGIVCVLGTPTAAPPAWLTQKYPEVLSVDQHGRQATHGNRCHFSPASPHYLEFCDRIASAMAERFGKHPNVIGWQIDNEYGRVSYDEQTRCQFQHWLRRRHETLEKLNRRWTTAYWSQEYSEWEQIPIPIGYHNPGLMLDWNRFVTHLYRAYQRVQIEAIRRHAEQRQWITHNFMGWFPVFDHYEVAADLDFASWDNYVGNGHLNYVDNGAAHDLTRGLKRKNFWLMETQPGWVNWHGVNNALDKGEVRCMAWHAIGHGADAVSYWQWRSALGGQEQYHGNLIAPDGSPRPLHSEVAQLGAELERVSTILDGTEPVASVAVLHSYDDRWAISFQPHHQDFEPVAHLLSYYRPLRSLTHTVDIVPPGADLSSYKLVVAPHLHLIADTLAARLTKYVEGGGHLLLGPRSGMKDEHNALLPSLQPGPLAGLLGAHVVELYALAEPIPIAGSAGTGQAKIWAEWLGPDAADVEVLASYGAANGWLDGQPALVTRQVGSGRITYLGTWLDESLMQDVVSWAMQKNGANSGLGPAPEGVEVCLRVKGEREVLILINHTPHPRRVAIPRPMRDLLVDRTCTELVSLPPRDVAVLVPA